MTNLLCQDFAEKVIRESVRKQINDTLVVFAQLEFKMNCAASHQLIREFIWGFYVDRGEDRAIANDCHQEWGSLMAEYDQAKNPYGKPIALDVEDEKIEGKRNLKTLKA